ncbi:MAG: HNH endonuclease [Methylovulum sp.]|nr:MAG: HNH endonuclease [Methylovulum sp.]
MTTNAVFVLDTTKKPLTPCSPARARALLRDGKAAVYRTVPFTLILKVTLPDAVVKPITVKIDPGSKTTGLALVDADGRVLFGAELEHRDQAIKADLASRRALRRGRRGRKTRYRAVRFNNRVRPKGGLPPSLQHRVDACAVERVKFDMQLMKNPEISGVEYQQGTLAGYFVRKYLLEKWQRQCAYCGAKHVPLQIEHVQARANGGTNNNISNLALACKPCNTRKGTRPIQDFLNNKPEALTKILIQLKRLLADAAAVNATRNKLFAELLKTGLPVETGTGAQTQFNRTRLDYPKAHWIDAACVGESGATVTLNPDLKPLHIKATGHGTRQTVRTNKHGFPCAKAKTSKRVLGIKTGDFVRLLQTKGKYKGAFRSRVTAIKNASNFLSISLNGKQTWFSAKLATLIQLADGYSYGY